MNGISNNQVLQLFYYSWFFEYSIDLNDETQQYNNRSDSDPRGAVHHFLIKCIWVLVLSTTHQEHTDDDDDSSDSHPQVIIFRKKNRAFSYHSFFYHRFLYFCHLIQLWDAI